MKKTKLILSIIAIAFAVIISYFAGYRAANNKFEEKISQNMYNTQTFYAEIKKIDDTTIFVKGLEVNDINYRGEFYFFINDEIKFSWRGTDIDIADLDLGDKVSVTYTGLIQETSPAGIMEVVEVQLLEDEK